MVEIVLWLWRWWHSW